MALSACWCLLLITQCENRISHIVRLNSGAKWELFLLRTVYQCIQWRPLFQLMSPKTSSMEKYFPQRWSRRCFWNKELFNGPGAQKLLRGENLWEKTKRSFVLILFRSAAKRPINMASFQRVRSNSSNYPEEPGRVGISCCIHGCTLVGGLVQCRHGSSRPRSRKIIICNEEPHNDQGLHPKEAPPSFFCLKTVAALPVLTAHI